MSMRYSASQRGFFPTDIAYANPPSDLVEISDDLYDTLMAAQTAGKTIVPGDDGLPVAVDPPAVMPTAEMVKAEASRRLAPTDWYAIRKADTGEGIPEAVAAYRSAVRAASGEIEAMGPIPADYADDGYWPELAQ